MADMGGSKEAEAVHEERDGRAGCLSLSPGRNAVKVAVSLWPDVHRVVNKETYIEAEV
jgi:hypothetical protein